MIDRLAIEAARGEFWRVLAVKDLTLEDAWEAAIEAADKKRGDIAKLEAWVDNLDFYPMGA